MNEFNILSNYLEGRKILFLDEQSNYLCDYFQSCIKKINNNSTFKAIDSEQWSDEFAILSTCDLVLAGIYSSVSSKRLIKKLKKYLDKLHKINSKFVVPKNIPQIIFYYLGKDNNNYQKWINNFFGDTYKNIIYHFIYSSNEVDYIESLCKHIRTALIDKALQILPLPLINGREEFMQWLYQFYDHNDRSNILKIMEHFRFYSAKSVIILFDYLLSINTEKKKKIDNSIIFFKGKYASIQDIWFVPLGRANKSGPATLPLVSKTDWMRKLPDKFNKEYSEKQNAYEPKLIGADKIAKELIFERLREGKNKKLCLVFVDDFIGSGGQLAKYFKNFLKNDLRHEAMQIGGKYFGPKIIKYLVEWMTGKKTISLDFLVIYAVGVKNDYIEKNFQEMCEYGNKYSKNNLGIRLIKGYQKISLEDLTGKKTNATIDINVHIADYTNNLKEIFKDDPDFIDRKLIPTLEKYKGIAKPRECEHWAQFEPLGWKDNGSLTATYANCQSNTLPIVWGDANNRIPLFERFFNPWSDGGANKELMESEAKIIIEKEEYKVLSNDKKNDAIGLALTIRSKSYEEIKKNSGIPVDDIKKAERRAARSEVDNILKNNSPSQHEKVFQNLIIELLRACD